MNCHLIFRLATILFLCGRSVSSPELLPAARLLQAAGLLSALTKLLSAAVIPITAVPITVSLGDSLHNLDLIAEADAVTLPDGTTELIADKPPTTINQQGQLETRNTSGQDPDLMMTTPIPITPSHLPIIERLFGLMSDEPSSTTDTTVSQSQTHVKELKRQAPPGYVQQPPQPFQQPTQVIIPEWPQQQPLQQSQSFQQDNDRDTGNSFIMRDGSPHRQSLLFHDSTPPKQTEPDLKLLQFRLVVDPGGETVQPQPRMQEPVAPQRKQEPTSQQTPYYQQPPTSYAARPQITPQSPHVEQDFQSKNWDFLFSLTHE